MSDPRIADLVAAGKVRFGTFLPQYSKDAATGELKGPWVEVMRALGAHMGLSVVLTELPTPVKLVECLDTGPCDVGSLGFDPARADQVGGFTPPFMEVEYTCLVPAASAIRSVADLDRPGILHRSRTQSRLDAGSRPHREASRAGQRRNSGCRIRPAEAGRADAWASARPALLNIPPSCPARACSRTAMGPISPRWWFRRARPHGSPISASSSRRRKHPEWSSARSIAPASLAIEWRRQPDPDHGAAGRPCSRYHRHHGTLRHRHPIAHARAVADKRICRCAMPPAFASLPRCELAHTGPRHAIIRCVVSRGRAEKRRPRRRLSSP